MAPRKKTPPKEQKVTEPVAAPKSNKCGHVNRHSMGTDQKLDNVTCDLPKGHTGDHSGVHKELQRSEDIKIVNGEEVVTVKYDEIERRTQWGDMAGIPVSEIPTPKPADPPTLRALDDRLRQIEQKGKFDPNKSVQGL